MANMDASNIRTHYESRNRRQWMFLFLTIAVTLLLGIYFVTIGVANTDMSQVVHAITAWITGQLEAGPAEQNAAYKIIVYMRLPRIAMAIIAGIGLSVSGVAMQAVTRNPLVSPFTMGVSNAAAFGASMCIVFGTGAFFKSELGIISCAFLVAILCIALVYVVSSRVGMGPETVVLTGIALNYLFSAMTSTIEFFAQEHRLAAVVQWAFGTFNGTVWSDVLFAGLIVVICFIIIMCNYLKLNVMASGDDELVRSLGINPKQIRKVMCVASVFMTAAIISFTGVIGFVGLVAPHIARILVGNDHKFILPFSAVIGSLLLMVSDVIGKSILEPVSIPVGIVVSFLGVPLFIHLILKGRRRDLS